MNLKKYIWAKLLYKEKYSSDFTLKKSNEVIVSHSHFMYKVIPDVAWNSPVLTQLGQARLKP